MTNLKNLLAAILLYSIAYLPCATAAEPGDMGQVIDQAYANDLHNIFNAEVLHKSLTKSSSIGRSKGVSAEVNRKFIEQITVMELEQRIQPALAKVASPEFASMLAEQMNKPAYRRWEIWADYAKEQGKPISLYLSQKELEQLEIIMASKPIREWWSMKPRLTEELKVVMSGWKKQYVDSLSVKIDSAMKQLDDFMGNSSKNNSESLAVLPIGIPSLDQYIGGMALAAQNFKRATIRLEGRMHELGVNDLLAPEKIATNDAISESLGVVNQAEFELTSFLADMNGIWAEYEQVANAIAANEGPLFRRANDASIAAIHSNGVAFGELCRRGLLQKRRMLIFLQSRLGSYRVVGDQVLFKNVADLDTMQEMRTQFSVIQAELRTLWKTDAVK